MKYQQLNEICAKAIEKGWCLGCQQLEMPYFRGTKNCKYVTNTDENQIKLNLDGGTKNNEQIPK